MARASARRFKRIREKISENSDRVAVALDEILPRAVGQQARLHSAMRYSALKHADGLRSFIIFEIGRLFKLDELSLLRIACAVECAHAHFQIHEDLPQLSDNAQRFGCDSLHIRYDEPIAVLAGNALMSAAFEILAHEDTHPDPAMRCALVQQLAFITGAAGSASLSERFDVAVETKVAAANLNRIHNAGRAAVMAYAAYAPSLLAGCKKKEDLALTSYCKDVALVKRLIDEIAMEADKDEAGENNALFGDWESCTKSYAALWD